MSGDYPLAGYNYQVSITGDDETILLGVAKVTGLNVEQQPVVYRHGMSEFMGPHVIFPKRMKPFNVTLHRGVFGGEEACEKEYLTAWVLKTFNDYGYSPHRAVQIQLMNAAMEVMVSWKINRAVPVSYTAPEFNASSDEVAVESLQLMAFDLAVEYE